MPAHATLRCLLTLIMLAMLIVPSARAAEPEFNGDFEAVENGWFAGWNRGDPGRVRMEEEGGNRFLRIQLDGEGSAIIGRRVPLDPSWQSIDISMRLRGADVKRPAADWQTGRLEYTFQDKDGKHVGGWPWIGIRKDGSTDGWQTLKAERTNVPDGAAFLNLGVGSWGATGTMDFDDIRVRPVESAAIRAVKLDPRKPDVLDNADFAQVDEKTGLPAGWEVDGDAANVRVIKAEGKPAVRIETTSGEGTTLVQRVPLHPFWARLDVVAETKVESVRLKEGGFWRQGATLLYRFFDSDGQLIHESHFGAREASDWSMGQHPNIEVPNGAVELEARIGFLDASGAGEFRGLQFRPHVVERQPGEVPASLAQAWANPEVKEVTRSRSRISLDDEWQFMPARGGAAKEPTSDWGLARVPGSWHDDVTGKGLTDAWLGFNPKGTNKAWYQRTVTIPTEWAGKAVELRFDRVSTDGMVWVNGHEAGELHWPGGTLEIGEHLKPGESNTIRVMVLAMNDREEVVHYMGYVDEPKSKAELDTRGITGSVELLARPRGGHVADVNIRPSVREKKLHLDVELAGVEEAGTLPIEATVLDPKSGDVAVSFKADAKVDAQPTQVVTISHDWPNPKLWDYKQPNLYNLRLALGSGEARDEFAVDGFGFREFWIDGRQFYMNGTLIHLRPGNIQYGATANDMFSMGFNFGHHWPEDQIRRGSRSDHDLKNIKLADEIGLLVDANLAHMRHYIDRWDNPAMREEWIRIMDAQVRKYRNHPSVVMYTHSANSFQWQGDGDPWDIGMVDVSVQQEYHNTWKRVQDAIAEVKRRDPKPVYAHFGTYNGDVYTSNLYLNFIPLQEREEWLSVWAKDGKLPFMAVEMGPPLYSSFNRMKDGYTPQGHSEPFPTEWAAVYFGKEAYAMEQPEVRELVASRYKGGNIKHEYDPHWRHDGKERVLSDKTGFYNVLDLFYRNTWRSFRTMGVSGGMIAWHHDYHPTLKEVNGDSLAWIAGPGGIPDQEVAEEHTFTEKTHHYAAGDTIEKQIVLINDFREPKQYTGSYTVALGDGTLATREISGELEVGEIAFLPLSVDLPRELQGRGEITLTATIGGQKHEDAFAFDVFREDARRRRISIAVYDPAGDTTKYLRSLGIETRDVTAAQPDGGIVVIGRKALSDGGQIPFDVDAFVKDGGRLLVMGQDPRWIEHALHLRTAQHVSRRVFAIDGQHPVLAGLDGENLVNWNGSSTLVEGYPNYPGHEWVPNFGWRWGNRHAVTSAAVEKPHRSSWRPILETEFDLAYSPLMEMDYGKGRVTLCTLDLEGRTAPDPAADRLARQLIEHVMSAELPGKAERVLYLGGERGRATLDALGVRYEAMDKAKLPADLIIVGPDAEPADAGLRTHLEAGGKVLVLRRETGALPLAASVVTKQSFFGSTDVPAWAEAAGLSASDLRWRNNADAALVQASGEIEVGAGGQIGRQQVGKGVIIYAQLGPDAVRADEKRYFRFTRWRQTRALSQLLANLGATFEQDEKMLALLKTPDHSVSLAGPGWLAAPTISLKESPTRQWHSPQPMSDLAKELVQPGASTSAFQQVWVPAYMEAYGPDWKWRDGETVFRRTINLPAHAAGKPLYLSIGRVDETETTFFNGTEVGTSKQWVLPRAHTVPGELVKAGENVIAIRNWDEGIHGGIAGSPNQIYVRVKGEDPGFYHPDYLHMEVPEGGEKEFQAAHEQYKVADNPYRYYRW